MKKVLTFIVIACASVLVMMAGDRPVQFEQLPTAIQTFINTHFQNEKISYAAIDDDFIRPDYEVVFANGTKIEFSHKGSMKKIESMSGIPESLVPVQLRDYAQQHYTGTAIVGYEIDNTTYEIVLSNGLELTFNKNFMLIEIDD